MTMQEVHRMRFGLILDGGNQPGRPRETAFKEVVERAALARRCGFHSLWTGPGYLNQGWHATVLLARIAAEAPDMELGMVGLLPLHHPVELAEQISTLDVICGGKCVLAAALGWRDFQFRAFEVPEGQRLSRFLEVLSALKSLWTQERVTHEGRHFHINDVPGAGVPLQRPHPKLLIAANLDPGVLRAAKLADGWLVSSRATLTTVVRQTELYRNTLQATGRSGYVAAWREMYVAADRSEAIATIRPHVEWLYRDRAALGHNRALPEADRIDVPFEQVLEGRFIIGSPEECAAELQRYQAAGVDEVIMRCQWPGLAAADVLKAIDRFGREVLPRFVG
jgi:alkanesulfonate monooxygenase SsuD/methylene tetrahydromethanopterin reductase-like flavin-dependent oxidoreductase (luciferase family)